LGDVDGLYSVFRGEVGQSVDEVDRSAGSDAVLLTSGVAAVST